MVLDVSVSRQTYVEDCEVCCKPIEISFAVEDDELTTFDAKTLAVKAHYPLTGCDSPSGGAIDVGLAGPYQVKGVTAYLSDFPNMYNPTVQNGIVRNGVLVADGKGFINPFTKLKEFGH